MTARTAWHNKARTRPSCPASFLFSKTRTDPTQDAQAQGEIVFRPYRAEDAAPLLDLFRASVHAIASDAYSAAQRESWAPADLSAEAFAQQRARTATWVAEFGGSPVGFSDLQADGHIEMLYVHPQFQRRGIARALLNHIESQAREASLRRLYAEASIPARGVFEAVGFRTIVSQTVVVRGEEMINYRMEKRLR